MNKTKIKTKYLESCWITTKGIKKSLKKKRRLHSKLKLKKIKKRKRISRLQKAF